MNEVEAINTWYKKSRRKYIKRYYKVIEKWNNRHKNAKPTENQFVKLMEKYNI